MSHVKSKRHAPRHNESTCSSKPLMSKPGISNSTIHAEILWASFVVEQNLAFNAI